MRLFDIDTERDLLRQAARGRGGKAMEPSDGGGKLMPLIGPAFGAVIYAYLPVAFLGAFDERLRNEPWQFLICSIMLMGSANFGLATLNSRIVQNGYDIVFANLPISGEHAFRWVRSRFFVEKSFGYACTSFICAFALHGFDFEAPWNLAATSLLLLATSFATTQLLQEPWLARLQFTRLWGIGSVLLFCWMMLLLFRNKRVFRIGETPEWMADTVMGLTWLFPPSWCMPGRFENGGAILAVAWIGFGAYRWVKWPANAAPYLDTPLDFAGTFDDSDPDEEDEGEKDVRIAEPESEPEPLHESGTEGQRGKLKKLPAPPAISTEGWVERLARRAIREEDQTAAGLFCDAGTAWTTRANWTLRVLPLWLAAVWLVTRFFPEGNWKETITIWIWILSIVMPFVGLMPFSNAVSTAYIPWYSGLQNFPIFSAMPVSVRSLLRISLRITFVRCVIMALIGTPYACLLMLVLLPQIPPGVSVALGFWLVPAFCCFWVTARPFFIWYRLQGASQRKNGTGVLVVQAVLLLLNIVLGIVALLSGFFGILSGFGYIGTKPEGYEEWFLPLGSIAGLAVSAICSRAIFEIYHWQLKRRLLDWVSSD